MELEWWQALVLGVVQGATEWLPVSSTGHLVLAEALIGTATPVTYDLLLHLGTLVVVMVAYRHRLVAMAKALWNLPRNRKNADSWRTAIHQDPDAHLALLLVIATVPIVVVGLTAAGAVEAAFTSPRFVGYALLGTALLLASTYWARPRTPIKNATGKQALVAGLFQAVAVLPGVSRSGAALAGALHAGLDRKSATDLAFLMAIPALAGATVFQARNAGDLTALGPAAILGLAAAMVVGYLTLHVMRALVQRYGLHPFAAYCTLVGVLVLVLVP